MHRVTPKALLVTSLGLAGSCVFPVDSCGCSPVSRSAVVFGVVTAEMVPVADAEVKLLPAGEEDTVATHVTARTDAVGSYELLVLEDDFFGRGQLTIRVIPDSASGLAVGRANVIPPWGSKYPPDTARVDIALFPQ